VTNTLEDGAEEAIGGGQVKVKSKGNGQGQDEIAAACV
jgi:hypothetical protein